MSRRYREMSTADGMVSLISYATLHFLTGITEILYRVRFYTTRTDGKTGKEKARAWCVFISSTYVTCLIQTQLAPRSLYHQKAEDHTRRDTRSEREKAYRRSYSQGPRPRILVRIDRSLPPLWRQLEGLPFSLGQARERTELLLLA